MATDASSDKMAMSTRAIGSTGKAKALASSPTIRATGTKASGLKMRNMAAAKRHSQQDNMKASFSTARKKDSAD